MKNTIATLVMAALMIALVAPVPAQAADKPAAAKKGGLLGNSYSSQYEQVTESRMRVTTRKKVQGKLDEINIPETSTNKAFTAITNAALVRAALEARNLGFKALKVSGTRDLSNTTERRSASSCPGNVCESDFAFAEGNYSTDVELALEVTMDMFKEVPADPTGYIDVEKTLKQFDL